MRRVVTRCLATGGGVLYLAVCLWLLLWVLIIASGAQAPDPEVPDGDPCCWRPDTWGEWAFGSGSTLASSLLLGLLVIPGVAVLLWGVTGRRPSARRLLLIPVGMVIGALLLVAVVLITTLDGSTY